MGLTRRKPIARQSKPIKRGKAPRKLRKTSRAKLKREADKLFSLYIRWRDGYECRNCHAIDQIQCAHIVSRRYAATRWTISNAICLCARCHLRFTWDTLAFEAWVVERFGLAQYDELKRIALAGARHVDYEQVIADLKKRLDIPPKCPSENDVRRV